MGIPVLHKWTNDPDEAIRIQGQLSQELVLAWDGHAVHSVCGIDLSYSDTSVYAAIASLHYPDLASISVVTGEAPLTFPYIPGLLAFRVLPAILMAWESLVLKPDLLLVHGHGIAHPRGIGLASHLGLWLNLPAIGVANSRLYGFHGVVGPIQGDWSEVLDESDPGQVIGAALRTRLNARPVYVSAGHLIDLNHALQFVLSCCTGFRLPEPLLKAHQTASARHQKSI